MNQLPKTNLFIQLQHLSHVFAQNSMLHRDSKNCSKLPTRKITINFEKKLILGAFDDKNAQTRDCTTWLIVQTHNSTITQTSFRGEAHNNNHNQIQSDGNHIRMAYNRFGIRFYRCVAKLAAISQTFSFVVQSKRNKKLEHMSRGQKQYYTATHVSHRKTAHNRDYGYRTH